MIHVKKIVLLLCTLFVVGGFIACGSGADDDNNPQNSETKYTVSYQSAYGSVSRITVKENTVLTEAELPNLPSDSAKFAGWYDGETLAVAGTYTVTKNVTLVAKWIPHRTISYSTSYVSTPGNAKVPEGTVLTETELPNLSSDSAKFAGWYDGDTLAVAGTYTVTKDVTLVAKWIPYRTISYSTPYGTRPEDAKVPEGTVLTSEHLPKLTADNGYIFAYWYIYKDGTEIELLPGSYTVTSDVRLSSKWVKNSSITVELPEDDTEISITPVQNGNSWTLTAETGFEKYVWRIDGTVQTETGNILTLDTASWARGVYEVSVEAEKGGEFYSARAYITVGGNE